MWTHTFQFQMLSQISLTFMQSKCLPFSTAKLALHKIYEKISRNFFINYMEHIHLHISQNFDLKMHNDGKKFLCYQLCIQGVPFEIKSEINFFITKTAHIWSQVSKANLHSNMGSIMHNFSLTFFSFWFFPCKTHTTIQHSYCNTYSHTLTYV